MALEAPAKDLQKQLPQIEAPTVADGSAGHAKRFNFDQVLGDIGAQTGSQTGPKIMFKKTDWGRPGPPRRPEASMEPFGCGGQFWSHVGPLSKPCRSNVCSPRTPFFFEALVTCLLLSLLLPCRPRCSGSAGARVSTYMSRGV